MKYFLHGISNQCRLHVHQSNYVCAKLQGCFDKTEMGTDAVICVLAEHYSSCLGSCY